MQDFQGLAVHLLSYSAEIVTELLPGGRLIGQEWTCGNLTGTQGDSCRVNLRSGKWSDFATDERGNDLISLYAACRRIKQSEAYDELSKAYNFRCQPERCEPSDVNSSTMSAAPSFKHYRHGEPGQVWTYRDRDGQPIYYIARYDTPEGKQYCPWSYHDGKLIARAHDEPRPLYNLDKIINNPEKPVLICEGEKSVDAAEKICGNVYVCTTWPNGSKSAHKADWSPLAGRNVLIWPDADRAGNEASENIVKILFNSANEIKTISPSGHSNGWDAADALNDGMVWSSWRKWAAGNVTVINTVAVANQNASANAVAAVQVNVSTEEDAGQVANYGLWEQLGIPLSGQGNPIISLNSGMRVLEGISELNGHFWVDKFYQRIFTDWGRWGVREWTDDETLELLLKFQREYSLARMTDAAVYNAVRLYAKNNQRNEPRDWLNSLEWDQKPRIQRFFCDYYGAEESEYMLHVSQNWWISMVARIFNPGCQCDNMIILKGPQGRFKSSSLRVIGGNWYTNCGHNVLSKDFYQSLQGVMIVEIGEMDSFGRAEVNTIKDVVSCPVDRYRAPYDRLPDNHPRQCVFVGTTNEDLVLKDHTGGRRFWPVDITHIKLDEIMRDREQLFAEAVSLYKSGSTWYEVPFEETLRIQEANRQYDEWELIFQDYFSKNFISQITTSQLATDCLKITPDKFDKRIQMRIGRCLKVLGWDRKVIRDKNYTKRIWERNSGQSEIEWEE